MKSGGSSDTLRAIFLSRLFALFGFFLMFSFLSFGFFALGDPFENTQISISPVSQTVDADDNFTIDVFCVPGQPIKAFELRLLFDASLVQADSVVEGDIFDNFSTFFNGGTIDNEAGSIVNIYGLIVGPGNVTDDGTFVTITFTAKQYSGTSDLEFIDVGTWTTVVNETEYVPVNVTSGSVEVVGGSSPPNPPPPPPGGGGFYFPPIPEENNPPVTPLKPSGATYVEMGVEYIYSSSTYDIDEDQIRLKFDWGDGNFSAWSDFVDSNTTVSMSYNWSSISTFGVRVIAQDIHGLNSSWSKSLNVTVSQEGLEIPPVVDIDISGKVSVNDTIIFDASGSYDLDGFIVSYEWDFGDGGTSSGISTSHIYNKSGEYTVTLIITDNLGNIYNKSIIVNIVSEGGFIGLDEQRTKFTFNIFMLIFGSAIAVIVFLTVIFKDQITLKFLKIQMHRIDKKMKKFIR